jgi:hypothetical protein
MSLLHDTYNDLDLFPTPAWKSAFETRGCMHSGCTSCKCFCLQFPQASVVTPRLHQHLVGASLYDLCFVHVPEGKGRQWVVVSPDLVLRKCVHYNVRKLRQISEAMGREDHRPLPSSFVEPREKFWVCAPQISRRRRKSGEGSELTMFCDRI